MENKQTKRSILPLVVISLSLFGLSAVIYSDHDPAADENMRIEYFSGIFH